MSLPQSLLAAAASPAAAPEYSPAMERQAPSSPSHSSSSADTLIAQEAPVPPDEAEARRPKRCKISREQLAVLIKSFDEEPLPNFDQRQSLAKRLDMTPRSVQIWFQNRRQRLKPQRPGGGEAHRASQQQQHIGMPGLAAVAGLCKGFHVDMVAHAMQLHSASTAAGAAGGGGGGLGSGSDVLDRFAATKALLNAGYTPPSTCALSPRFGPGVASPCGGVPALADGALPPAAVPPGVGYASASGGAAAAASQPAAPAADGLLLLLACADGKDGGSSA